MHKIPVTQRDTIREYVRWFLGRYNNDVLNTLSDKIRFFEMTQELAHVLKSLDDLYEALGYETTEAFINLHDDLIPCLKRVLIARRRDEASTYEAAKKTTINPDLIAKLESKVQPLNEMLKQNWLQDIKPMKVPSLNEYLSIQQIEEPWFDKPYSNSREFDEKFHILQAPNQLLADIQSNRLGCELRDTSLVIGFIDIDNFKQFNTKYGHTEVDRRILPQFMRLLEAHIFSHGYVYRYGGDEYALLLPNFDYELTRDFLESLRKKVAEMRYPSIDERITVSIGFCYLDSDSYLTNQEAEERASKAMSFAKEHGGKNCIASYIKGRFDDGSLQVVSSASEIIR
ncbi:MAG: diguanylate cyclase [Pyrinomonadaceae bacterium]